MQAYKSEFLDFAIRERVLRFGEFKLKSGRLSPYFFDAGLFNSGQALAQLGRFYAEAIREAELPLDMLFGPAYKGIPLVVSTAIALANNYNRDIPVAFNRKEQKDHGEGGWLVGAPLHGRVVIVDDVITAGTAVRESIELIRSSGAVPAGVIIALDRQEAGPDGAIAIDELKESYQIPIVSIAQLDDLVAYLEEKSQIAEALRSISAYRDTFKPKTPEYDDTDQ